MAVACEFARKCRSKYIQWGSSDQRAAIASGGSVTSCEAFENKGGAPSAASVPAPKPMLAQQIAQVMAFDARQGRRAR